VALGWLSIDCRTRLRGGFVDSSLVNLKVWEG